MRSPIRWLCVLVLATGLSSAVRAADDENPLITLIKTKVKAPDKPFTVLVVLKVKDGMREKFEAALKEAIAETRKEKGNLRYELTRDLEDESRFAMYEKWQNVAAIEAHGRAKYFAKLGEVIGPMLDGPPELHVGVPAAE